MVILGLPIPSSSPLFLITLAAHVVAGLLCVIAGGVAMLSPKRVGRHPSAGAIYYWSLVVVFASMMVLSVMRWPHDIHLVILGMLSLVAGFIGRAARRQLWVGWTRIHITGMALSYILLLTAFYVDNGPNLPVWRHFPALAYWLAPSLAGLPILAWALVRRRSGR
ncbi:MAG TPA: DUF2306 domain-containing protein [Myxococcota bacterium]|jgi:hypothetical protein